MADHKPILGTGERLVFRKLPFWIKNLCITPDLLRDLRSEGLVSADQLANLEKKYGEAQQTGCTVELHEALLFIVLTMSNDNVDCFLQMLEKYQPQLIWMVLGGRSTAEVIHGSRGSRAIVGGTARSASVSSDPGSIKLSSPRSSIDSVSSGDAMEAVALVPDDPPLMSLSEYLHQHNLPAPGNAEEQKGIDIIGVEGGKVFSEHEHVKLTFPFGALMEPTEINPPEYYTKVNSSLNDADGLQILSGMTMVLHPHGQQFNQPVAVEVREGRITPGCKVVLLASDTTKKDLPEWYDATDSSDVAVDHDNKLIRFMANHFSMRALFIVTSGLATAAAMAAIYHAAATKDLYVSIFWDRDGSSDTARLLVWSSYDKDDLSAPPGGYEKYQHAAGPSTRVPLTYWDSYQYSLDVEGATVKNRDKNKLMQPLDRPSQSCLRLSSCCERVEISLECTSTRQQVMLVASIGERNALPPTSAAPQSQGAIARNGFQFDHHSPGAMSERRRQVLLECWDNLVKDLPPDTLDHLVQCGVFCLHSEEYQEIKASLATHGRISANRELLKLLPNSNVAFDMLVKVLSEDGLHRHLGQSLMDKLAC